MAVPKGYRLLRADDVGKTFGMQLAPCVYIDVSVTPNFFSTPTTQLLVQIDDTTRAEWFNFYSGHWNNLEGYQNVMYVDHSIDGDVPYCTYDTQTNQTNWSTYTVEQSEYSFDAEYLSDAYLYGYKIMSISADFVETNNYLYVKDEKTVKFNNKILSNIKFNGNTISNVYFNGNKVF